MPWKREYICNDCLHIFKTTASERIKNGCPNCGAHYTHTSVYRGDDTGRLVSFLPLFGDVTDGVLLLLLVSLLVILCIFIGRLIADIYLKWRPDDKEIERIINDDKYIDWMNKQD